MAINPEDGARYSAPVRELDPPAVARILRVHRNAEAVICPFLILGLVYVLLGVRASIAVPIFAIFAAARIVHSPEVKKSRRTESARRRGDGAVWG